MKIVQLVTRMDSVGGAQIHVKDLSIALNNLGHEVIVLSKGSSYLTKELIEQGVEYRELLHLKREIHPYFDIKAAIEMYKTLKEIQPDIIATHSSKAGLLGRYVGWLQGIPTVFTAHGWAFTEGVSKMKRILYKGLERLAGKMSTGIITVSDYDHELALASKIVPKQKIQTIHNGVSDTSAYLRAVPEARPIRLIMVARFAAPKDHLSVIKALSELSETEWELDLVGDGTLRPEIERLVDHYGLEHRVHFHGHIDDVSKLLSRSKIFILISNWEGLPLCIIEAMRSGLPVIASDVGGVPELIKHNQNGYLVPRKDVESLRKYLRTLLENSRLRADMGMRGRELYEEYFTFETMRHKTVYFYEEIRGKNRLDSN